MAAFLRMIMGLVLSAFIARIIDGLMSPKQKLDQPKHQPRGREGPMLDLKPCPVCGIYTAQPATHCK